MTFSFKVLHRHFITAMSFAFFWIGAPAFSATLDFDFSFTEGSATLEGRIFGLEDNATTGAPRVIVNLVGTSDVGLEFLLDDPEDNFVSVTNGEVQVVSILQSALIGTDNYVLQIFSGEAASDIFQTNVKLIVTRGDGPDPTEIFSTVFDTEPLAPFTQVSQVPVPAAGLLLIGGLGLLGAARRRQTVRT